MPLSSHTWAPLPSVFFPISGITAITSAGKDGPFGTALGTEAGTAAAQFCLEWKGRKREKNQTYP